MGCKKRQWIHAHVPVPPAMVIGEKGMTLLKADPLADTPVLGEFTGTYYPFNERIMLFVDTRDAVFLLGDQFSVVER
jgi:hypothetical protein